MRETGPLEHSATSWCLSKTSGIQGDNYCVIRKGDSIELDRWNKDY